MANNYLTKKPFPRGSAVGLDIADRTIEAVELESGPNGVKLKNSGRISIGPGIVERGRIKDSRKLQAVLKRVFDQARPRAIKARKAVFGLPDALTYSHIFILPAHRRESRDNLVREEAIRSLPLPESELLFSYRVLSETKEGGVEILIVAASRTAVNEWSGFFRSFGLAISVFDIEILATFRGLFIDQPTAPVCLIDIGAVATKIGIFDQNGPRYLYTINLAGDEMTAEIMKSLKLSFSAAEKLKKEIGLGDPAHRLFNILTKPLERIISEVKESIGYFRQRTGQPPDKVVLVGGTSRLKNIIEYFHDNLGLPVESALPGDGKILYLEAAGLAMRELDKRNIQKNPFITIDQPPDSKTSESEYFDREESKEDAPAEASDNFGRQNKLKRQKIILVVILLAGALIIGGAWLYRNANQPEKNEAINSAAFSRYGQSQTLEVEIILTVDPAGYSAEKVRGRIAEDYIDSAAGYAVSLAQSRLAVEAGLKDNEALWPEPVDYIAATPESGGASSVKWLVYYEDDLDRLAIREVDRRNSRGIDYQLDSAGLIKIEPSGNPKEYILTAQVSLYLDQLIDL